MYNKHIKNFVFPNIFDEIEIVRFGTFFTKLCFIVDATQITMELIGEIKEKRTKNEHVMFFDGLRLDGIFFKI